MRRWISAGLLALTLLVPMLRHADAQNAADPAIPGVIQRQIDAFRAGDVATAFSFASPMIKGMFGTPETFGTMVQQGYPMVWRPDVVTYLDQELIGAEIWQKVQIRDTAGQVHTLGYRMIQTPDGWRINGVQLLPEPDVGV